MEILSEKDENHPWLEMPPLESHYYLIEWLFDVGPTMNSSMGTSPLTYQEIVAWEDGIDLTPWEKKTLRALSTEYMSWSHKGTKKGCVAPYIRDTGLPDKEKSNEISNSIADYFKSFRKPTTGLKGKK